MWRRQGHESTACTQPQLLPPPLTVVPRDVVDAVAREQVADLPPQPRVVAGRGKHGGEACVHIRLGATHGQGEARRLGHLPEGGNEGGAGP